MFEKRIVHAGLNAYRLVKGQTAAETEGNAVCSRRLWEERWQRKSQADRARDNRAKKLQQRSSSTEQATAAKALALEQTRDLELYARTWVSYFSLG